MAHQTPLARSTSQPDIYVNAYTCENMKHDDSQVPSLADVDDFSQLSDRYIPLSLSSGWPAPHPSHCRGQGGVAPRQVLLHGLHPGLSRIHVLRWEPDFPQVGSAVQLRALGSRHGSTPSRLPASRAARACPGLLASQRGGITNCMVARVWVSDSHSVTCLPRPCTSLA